MAAWKTSSSLLLLCVLAIGAVSALPAQHKEHREGKKHGEHMGWMVEKERDVGDFDINYTVSVAEVAFASYCSEKSLEAWSCRQCKAVPYIKYVGVVSDLITSTFGFVAVDLNTKTTYISFRGSINIPNWVTNFEFIKARDWVDAPDAKLHSGFYHAYLKVRDQLKKLLADKVLNGTCPSCTRVVVTGHSLGAALAGICAMDLRVLFGSQLYIELVNFGMPRTGNEAFFRDYPRFVNFTRRVVHQNDIVPHLPPYEIGFRHVTTEVWSQGEGTTNKLKFTVCSATDGEDPNCSDSVPPKDYSVNDHLIYMGVVTTHC
eukprot:m.226243 g.226243  ORF g.226243 m.226243 type:complete len:317 (-) comp16901_c0_seq1:40-990(-)